MDSFPLLSFYPIIFNSTAFPSIIFIFSTVPFDFNSSKINLIPIELNSIWIDSLRLYRLVYSIRCYLILFQSIEIKSIFFNFSLILFDFIWVLSESIRMHWILFESFPFNFRRTKLNWILCITIRILDHLLYIYWSYFICLFCYFVFLKFVHIFSFLSFCDILLVFFLSSLSFIAFYTILLCLFDILRSHYFITCFLLHFRVFLFLFILHRFRIFLNYSTHLHNQ